MSKKTTSALKICTIIGSIFGVLFVLLGSALIRYEPLGGLLYMVIAVLMISPLIKLIEQEFNIRMSVVVSLVCIIILFAIVVVVGSERATKSAYNKSDQVNVSNNKSDNNIDNYKLGEKDLAPIKDKPKIQASEEDKPKVRASKEDKTKVQPSEVDKPRVRGQALEEDEPKEQNEKRSQENKEHTVEEVNGLGWLVGGSLANQGGIDGNNGNNEGIRRNSTNASSNDSGFNATDNSARSSDGVCPETNVSILICDVAAGPFSLIIDNGFFPKGVGSESVLQGEDEEGEMILIVIAVLDETEEIAGITTRVVAETEFRDGELVEVSRNFYAQAPNGTVCYFGVDVQIFEDGFVVSNEGSWRAGENGNLPRIVMPANPEVGMVYSHDAIPGVAEDQTEVLALGETVEVPAGTFDDTLTVKECNRLDEEATDEKIYVRGIGLAIDEAVKLISF